MNRPGRWVVKSGQQQREDRLSRARAADDSEPLAGSDVERQIVQDGGLTRVGKGDALEGKMPIRMVEPPRRGGIFDLRLEVEAPEHALRAHARLLAVGEHPGEEPHRRDQLSDVAAEGEKDAQADLSAQGQRAPESQHAELRERRKRLERRRVARRQTRSAQARAKKIAGASEKEGQLLAFLPERLDHAHARHGLFHHARQRPRELLVTETGREDSISKAHREDDEHGHEDRDHQRQQRREEEHRRDRDEQERDVRHEQWDLVHEALHQGHVPARACHDVPGRELLVRRHVQGVQVPLDCDTQSMHELDARFCGQVAPPVVEYEGQGPDQDQGREPGCEWAALAQDGVIQDDLLDQGQEPHRALPNDRQDNRAREQPALEIWSEPRPPIREGFHYNEETVRLLEAGHACTCERKRRKRSCGLEDDESARVMPPCPIRSSGQGGSPRWLPGTNP